MEPQTRTGGAPGLDAALLQRVFPLLEVARMNSYGAPENFLRRLIDAGLLSEEDVNATPTNELRRMLMPGDSGGFVRNEETGSTTLLNGRAGGAFDSVPLAPRQVSGGAYPDQASRAMDQGQVPQLDPRAMTPQGFAQPRQERIRMAGYGGGVMSDLGETTGPAPRIDMTRPALETPQGKAYYGKDGSPYILGPEGWTKIALGYDRRASMEMNKADLARRQTEQQIAQSQASVEHTREQTEASRALRNQREGLAGMGPPQSLLEKQFGKAPDGMRWQSNGQLEEIPGGGGGKLTEFQGKSSAFGTRAANAHEILNSVGGDGSVQPGLIKRGAEAVPLVGGALGTALNWTQSDAQQQVEQAQRDFINATLRQESGAAISASEFDNATRQYFPQPSDGAAVIAQKKRNRELVVSSFADSAGPAKRRVIDSGTKARALFEAKAAIRQGASPEQVKARLQAMGITDSGI
jgi:hypothetical protein